MLLVITLESLMFGLLGYAIFKVGTKMEHGYDRTATLWVLSIVFVLLGIKLAWDLVIDGSRAIDSGTFGAAVTGVIVIAGCAAGIGSYFAMLSTQRDATGNVINR